MTNHRISRIAAGVVAVGVVGTGGGLAASGAFAASPHGTGTAAVKLATLKVGGSSDKLLVNSAGKPIYLLTGDSMKMPLCTDSECLQAWPAVTATSAKPSLGPGVKGTLTIWKHKGMNQVVLNGHPLYLFAGDSGSTAKGQDIKDDGHIWELMTSSGAGFTGSASSSGSSASGASNSSSSSATTTSSPASGWS